MTDYEEGLLPAASARQYVLAGYAVVTFRNALTGNRFTYKVRRPDDDHPHFVSIRTASGDWSFMGTIFDGETYRHGKRTEVVYDSKVAVTWRWLWDRIDDLPPEIEVWHQGRCMRCGRRLTVPESIQTGYGPICSELLGV